MNTFCISMILFLRKILEVVFVVCLTTKSIGEFCCEMKIDAFDLISLILNVVNHGPNGLLS